MVVYGVSLGKVGATPRRDRHAQISRGSSGSDDRDGSSFVCVDKIAQEAVTAARGKAIIPTLVRLQDEPVAQRRGVQEKGKKETSVRSAVDPADPFFVVFMATLPYLAHTDAATAAATR
ncbi:hypothetical protein MAPG_08868 [Magnaporthiopsis poae ATCC 64411]|uniref:Uncharacterized protein n=1 Tax=Magnaporthiopsis poae (strain ATCC 64411 / 73-15) TaxID=644358 RepID=A0A0C4E8G6_MAGP6|nr:hypothetical protein MAPG_08868 [Magnaporthiopsis poae ATCC 64411]